MESLSLVQTIPVSEVVNLTKDIASLNATYLGITVSIILAVLAILGGAFYLFNFRPLKESIDKQEKQITDRIKDEDVKNTEFKKEIRDAVVSNKAEMVTYVDSAVEEAKSNLSLDFQKRIAEFEVALIQKVTEEMDVKDTTQRELITSEVSDKLRKLEGEMKSQVEAAKDKMETTISQTAGRITTLADSVDDSKVDIIELQRFMYSQQHKAGAFYKSIDLLRDAIAKYKKYKLYSWLVLNRLNELKNEIDGYILEPDVITKIETELIKIDKEKIFSPLISEIRAITAKDRVTSPTSSESSRAEILQSTTPPPQ